MRVGNSSTSIAAIGPYTMVTKITRMNSSPITAATCGRKMSNGFDIFTMPASPGLRIAGACSDGRCHRRVGGLGVGVAARPCR